MSEACGCIYVDSCEGAGDFQSSEMRKARKVHRCCACGRVIQPREKYEYVFSVSGGATIAFKTCADCLSLRDAFFCDGYFFEEIWSDFCHHVRDMDGEIAGSCLAGLTKRARDEACDIIEQHWGENDKEKDNG